MLPSSSDVRGTSTVEDSKPQGAGGFLLGFTIVDALSMGILLPVLPFALERLGATPTYISLHLAFFSLGTFVCAPLLGRLADRVGGQHVIGTLAVITMLAICGLWITTSWVVFLGLRILHGAGGAKEGLIQAFAMASTSAQNRAPVLARLGTARLIGLFVGPVIGGTVASLWIDRAAGLSASLAASFVCALVALGLWFVGRKNGRGVVPDNVSEILAETEQAAPIASNELHQRLSFALGINLILGLCLGVVMSLTALTLDKGFGLGFFSIGLIFGVLAVAVAVARFSLSVRLAQRFGAKRSAATLALLLCAAMTGMGLANTTISFLLFLFAAGLLVGALPILTTLLVEEASAIGNRNRNFGSAIATIAAGQMIAATFGGYVFENFGHGAPYSAVGVAFGVVLLAALILDSLRRTFFGAAQPVQPRGRRK